MNGNENKDVQKHYLLVDGLVYYLSNVNDDQCLRLFVPKHLRTFVVNQYHDLNGHMGVQKTFDSIRRKYFWPNLFKELNTYVTGCTVCQTRSLQKIRQPLQETDIPPYSMAKVSVNLSGPYPTSLSGNKYMMHKIALQKQHKSFVAVRNNLKSAKKRQANMPIRVRKMLSLR